MLCGHWESIWHGHIQKHQKIHPIQVQGFFESFTPKSCDSKHCSYGSCRENSLDIVQRMVPFQGNRMVFCSVEVTSWEKNKSNHIKSTQLMDDVLHQLRWFKSKQLPVVPHKAVAEVSIGNLWERLVVLSHGWQSKSTDGSKCLTD